MKKLKKVLRLCGLILFLILAGIGISVTGAAQVPPKRGGRDNDNQILIEMVEKGKEEKDTQGDEAFY
jgi:hypothetical protein